MRQDTLSVAGAVFEPSEQSNQFGTQTLNPYLIRRLLAGGLNTALTSSSAFSHFFDTRPGEYVRPDQFCQRDTRNFAAHRVETG